MKKVIKLILAALASIVFVTVVYVLFSFPPIMRGMAAKTMCSCVFVGGRTPESVIAKELQVFPGLAELDIKVDRSDSSVTASLLWRKSKAIYRPGLGCTLLAKADESSVRAQAINTFRKTYPSQADILWPTGDLHAVDSSFNESISEVIKAAFLDRSVETPLRTHAIVAVYNGKIIGEKYAPEFGVNSIHTGWSMTKSVTNALVGILVRSGRLERDKPAPVSEWQKDDRKNITLNHLLQASSGLSWSESYFVPGADFHNMFIHSDDKAAYAISRKLRYKPGQFFQYSSGTTNIISKLIRQSVGDSLYHRFPYDSLFFRIGMYHTLLEVDASGTFVASSYGHATARDWARLGLLYLNDGVWNGQRILPEGWVKYSTTPAPAAQRRQYGAQIWLNAGAPENPEDCQFPGLPSESIVFSGFEENYVVIVPSKKLVVVRLGVTHGDFDIAGLVNGIIENLPESNSAVAKAREKP